MKVSQLKEVIRAKVRETLYTGPNAVAAVKNDAVYNALPPIEKTKVNVALQKKQSVNLEEDDIKPGEYTMAKIYKMNRAELIDFIDPNRELSHVNRSTDQLRGDALEMADDNPEHSVSDYSSVDESGTGDQPISSMSREDLLRHFDLDLDTPEEELSTEYLRDAISGLDEADYIDDDDTVHEGVDDDNTDFKDYNSVYEDMEDTSSNVDKYKLGELKRR
jgi:hypothetical protein